MENLSLKRSLDIALVSEIVGEPVKKFSLAEGSKKGDNVIGKMLALNVETEKGAILDVVVKSLLPFTGELDAVAIAQSDFFVALQVFPTEIRYYQDVRPLLQQVNGFACNKPKVFSSIEEGIDAYIALEDLRTQGYKMADKRKGLNLDEVSAVLKKLAELHAHSYALISQNNPTMQQLQSSVLNGHIWARRIPSKGGEEDLDQEIFFNAIIEKMVEVMREIGEVDTAGKMEKFAQTGYKIMIDLWQKRGKSPKYFEVIIHGDMWTNNVLFKHTPSGEILEDLVFIDFQQSRFGTIYEDLLYFVFTSTTAEFRKQHLKTILELYFQEFERALASLENPTPLPPGFTSEELIATFYENLEYGFCYELVGIPFQLGGDQPEQASPPPDAALPQKEQQPTQAPSPMQMVLMMAEVMKIGTKNTPIAVQRLKELCAEMIKLNILS